MAVGDQANFLTRLKAVLPNGWFTGSTPVLDAILSGYAWALALGYDLIAYVRLQTRISTATDAFLDLIAWDYFGAFLRRRQGEYDTPFRSRILANLLRERATRKGMRDALFTLTGREPILIEPERPLDTGAYGVGISGYGTGHYGSVLHHHQAFVIAFRSIGSGIPNIGGYGSMLAGAFSPTRASSATYFNATGNLVTAGVDVARYGYDPVTLAGPTLVLENAATNYYRNNTMVGAVAGSPGTYPTYWGHYTGSGMTRQIVGTGTENGIDYVDIRIFGTAVVSDGHSVEFEGSPTQVPTVVGDTWTASTYLRMVAGSLAGISTKPRLNIESFDAGGVSIGLSYGASFTPTGAALRTQRMSQTASIALANAAYVDAWWEFSFNAGAVIDVTFRFGLPQLEKGTVATSAIKTSGANGSRAADIYSAPAGYGAGQAEYGTLSMIQGAVLDSDIYAAIDQAKPAGTQVWASIQS